MIARVRGKDIYFRVQGEGPPLLLLHGFLESSSMWDGLAAQWRKAYRVIAPDLPGHGKSAILGSVHHMEGMAKAALAVLDELNIASTPVIGHSMGGYVALALAQTYPDRITSLVLMNSTTFADSPERLANRERALKLLERDKNRFVQLTIPALFAPATRSAYAEAIGQMQDAAQNFPLKGITAAVRGMMARPDRTSVLKNLTVPKMMIYGTDDPLIPSNSSRQIAKATNCMSVPVSGGHMLHLENPGEIVKIVHFIE